ncbi:hypothetical protein NL676_025029 [Syzygium grande]|nr:hypothetical protein NL676_025029 [Syzygium grande]
MRTGAFSSFHPPATFPASRGPATSEESSRKAQQTPTLRVKVNKTEKKKNPRNSRVITRNTPGRHANPRACQSGSPPSDPLPLSLPLLSLSVSRRESGTAPAVDSSFARPDPSSPITGFAARTPSFAAAVAAVVSDPGDRARFAGTSSGSSTRALGMALIAQ